MAETTKDLGWVPEGMTFEEAEQLVEMNGMTYLWQPRGPASPEEYLRREAISLEKSEYHGGRVRPLWNDTDENGNPMPGATRSHNRLSMNLVIELGAALRGSECLVYGADMRIAAKPGGGFYYADVAVVCGEERYVEDQTIANMLNPTLLVEVLSPSTEQVDRGEKFEAYRTLDSFQEYVLVAQDRRHVEVFRRREADGRWVLYEYGADDETIELVSIEARIEMDALYARVDFESA